MGNDTLTYEASISGWSVEGDEYPKLDSIKFDLRGFNIRDKEVITKTITKPQRGLKLAPAVGVGYGVVNRKPDIWIGVGITYNF